MLSILKLEDVNGEPKVKLDLPSPLRIGDVVGLRFRIERSNGGRTEVLEVNGKFRITAIGFDTTRTPTKQLLSVSSTGGSPTWRAVKKRALVSRRLAPAVLPKTSI